MTENNFFFQKIRSDSNKIKKMIEKEIIDMERIISKIEKFKLVIHENISQVVFELEQEVAQNEKEIEGVLEPIR